MTDIMTITKELLLLWVICVKYFFELVDVFLVLLKQCQLQSQLLACTFFSIGINDYSYFSDFIISYCK